jgi:hypothetical protein
MQYEVIEVFSTAPPPSLEELRRFCLDMLPDENQHIVWYLMTTRGNKALMYGSLELAMAANA